MRLPELQVYGFAPQAIICDSGSGLQAGQELALPAIPRRGDVFHVEAEVLSLVTALENRAIKPSRPAPGWNCNKPRANDRN